MGSARRGRGPATDVGTGAVEERGISILPDAFPAIPVRGRRGPFPGSWMCECVV